METKTEWSIADIEAIHSEIRKIALDELKLDVYPVQIELITADQMIDAYTSFGLPVMYKHWSFGKRFISNMEQYKKGRMGLAYEIVINSSPCIAYLMEDNDFMMQSLVIAHACYGHNHVFKNNYLFQKWTNADTILEYLVYARDFIAECEEKYGAREVMLTLDACHALQGFGVDRYERPPSLTPEELEDKRNRRLRDLEQNANSIWDLLDSIRANTNNIGSSDEPNADSTRFPSEPEENIMRFLSQNAQFLKPWQREILNIAQKLEQYFYPQRQTQVINEGAATAIHHYIMQRLHEKKLLSDDHWMEFLTSHTAVINQPVYSRFNPYHLGFKIFQEIKRVSISPTEEDREWFGNADWVGAGNWIDCWKYAIRNFRDDSFIQQYVTPNLIRDLKIFTIEDLYGEEFMKVTEIQDSQGYKNIVEILASNYTLSEREPRIEVTDVDILDTRELTLVHYVNKNEQLLDEKKARRVLEHIKYLWGFDVHLDVLFEDEGHSEWIESWSTKILQN